MQYGGMLGVQPRSTSSGGSTGGVSLSGDELLQAQRLMHYKTYGEESYVFQHKDVWEDFLQSFVAINDIGVSSIAFNFLIENNIDPLIAMGNVYGTGINFKQYSNFADIVVSGENVRKIIDHPVLSKMVYGYVPYTASLYGPDSAIWDIMDLDLANSVATNSAFLSYVENLPTLTSQESVPDGYYFLVKINVAGRSYSSDSDDQSYRVAYFKGCSGASYKDYAGNAVNIQTAITVTQSNSSTNGTGSISGLGDRNIMKFAKAISLSSATSVREHFTMYNGGTTTWYTDTFKSTAYYKVIRS